MKQYYYLDNNKQVGPFTLEQLRTQPLTPNTLVWTEGMSNWARVVDTPEVRDLMGLGSIPPINPQPVYAQPGFSQPTYAFGSPTGFMPKTWLTESILVTLFCCLPLGIVGIINASRVESRYRVGDFNGAQQASLEAGRWTKIGFFSAFIIIGLYFLLIFAGIFSGFGRRYY